MPNQYTRVALSLDIQKPNDTSQLNIQYTKALFEILKNKLNQNPELIDEIIMKVKQEL
jgi:regulatory protein YycH of two-component signal transduction system YycFG